VPFAKRDSWSDAGAAAAYEERRFQTRLQRRKHRRDEAAVLALLARFPVQRVLDLPAGTGRLLPCLSRAGYAVVAADVAAEMLRHVPRAAGAGPLLGRVRADAERLPFRTRAVDAVVSLRFLFHVDDGGARRAVLAEMARASRGVVIGQVRYRGTLKHALRWLRSRAGLSRRYRPSQGRGEIAAELEAAGLALLELRPISRLFSDKALFLARVPPARVPTAGAEPPG
jgi:SAM-dependent methyltransferase